MRGRRTGSSRPATAFGRSVDLVLRELHRVLARGLGLEAHHARRHRRAAFADFTEFGRELGILDPHQWLALSDESAFLNKDRTDNAAFERLHHLHLARRNHAAIAALHFVEDGEMRPDQPDHEQPQRAHQNEARRARRAQFDRRADVVGECEIRLLHWSSRLVLQT